jgi:hypothetical protein
LKAFSRRSEAPRFSSLRAPAGHVGRWRRRVRVVQARERAVLLATIVRTMRASGCHEGQGLEALRLIAGASARALRPALLVAEELLGSGQIIQDDASTFGEIGKQW